MRRRVLTGMSVLDKMLNGGIPEGNQVAIAGSPGAGKTLTSFEYLYKNAKVGNKGVLFSLEESPEEIIENAKDAFTDFEDIDELIKKGDLSIDGTDITDTIRGNGPGGEGVEMTYAFGTAINSLSSTIKSHNAKRVVIDSLTTFKQLIKDPLAYRMLSLNLIRMLKNLNVTSLLTLEVNNASRQHMQYLSEFFIYDGIIALYSTAEEQIRIQSMEVLKMRGTKHSFKTIPYVITSGGLNPIIAVENVM